MRRLAIGAAVFALAAAGVVTVTQVPATAVDNGLALTPPMGWNGFNHFSHDVTASLVEAEARAIVSSGMKDAGYQYVNLDGGWNLLDRGPDGQLQADPAKFPDGIKALADYVHSLGLKFGIYAAAGTTNCAGTAAGSYGHYQQDADTFASWGVDYVKFDRCAVPYDDYPDLTHPEVTQLLATQMHDALVATGRPMVFDVNDAMQAEHDWTWAPPIANLWRIVGDIADTYNSLVTHVTADITNSANTAPGGGWNDPDVLEVGNGGMTDTEDQSEFSLWAELAAPLIAGNDLTSMSATTRGILTNPEVIAVDQDPLGKQGVPVSSADGHWVLTKPLANGDRAVVLFNQTDSPTVISTSTDQVGLPAAPAYAVRDLWAHTTTETAGVISSYVPAHGVAMYRVAAASRSAAGHYLPQATLNLSASNAVLPAGRSTTVTSTLTDDGLASLDHVTIAIQVPTGWTATPLTPTTFSHIGSRMSVSASWQVRNAYAPGGATTILSRAIYASGQLHGDAAATTNLIASYPTLDAAFNNVGISDDANPGGADFSGSGTSYSAQALAGAGLSPGASLTHDGVSLTWPDVPAGTADNVIAAGQPITTSGTGTTLGFLGSATGPRAGATGTGTIYYTDGTTSDYTITFNNWFHADPGNDVIATTSYYNKSTGTANGPVYIFYTSAPIDPGKTIAAVTLPGSTTGTMHIFTFSVGG